VSAVTAATAADVLYGAWANASEIIPQVNRLVIGHWINDFQWNPEGCFNRVGLPKGNGFVDVLEFGQACNSPVEGSNISPLNAYVASMGKGGNPLPAGTITPVDVTNSLRSLAAASDQAVAWLRTSLGGKLVSGSELDATLKDIEVFALLGRYYAGKLCGATEIELFKATRLAAHKAAAVSCLQDAVGQWDNYRALATSQYVYPQLLGRVTLLDLVSFTSSVEADVALAQNA
jgi:hypothetical protein